MVIPHALAPRPRLLVFRHADVFRRRQSQLFAPTSNTFKPVSKVPFCFLFCFGKVLAVVGERYMQIAPCKICIYELAQMAFCVLAVQIAPHHIARLFLFGPRACLMLPHGDWVNIYFHIFRAAYVPLLPDVVTIHCPSLPRAGLISLASVLCGAKDISPYRPEKRPCAAVFACFFRGRMVYCIC